MYSEGINFLNSRLKLDESIRNHTEWGGSLDSSVNLFMYLAMLPLFLGLNWVAFDKKKEGLYGHLAGSIVVHD